LIAPEEKQLVFDRRTSERQTGLVLFQLIGRMREEAVGVERGVSDKPKRVPMERVCAAPGDDVDRSTQALTERGSAIARLHAELLDGVRKREWHIEVFERILIISPVQSEREVVLARSVDGELTRRECDLGPISRLHLKRTELRAPEM
jgi:hypothetical protein